MRLLPRVSEMFQGQVSFGHTGSRPIATTNWLPVFGASRARVMVDTDAMTNVSSVTPAVRMAAVRTDTTGDLESGSGISTNTTSVQTFDDINSGGFPQSNFWIQGVLLGAASDTTGATAYLKLQLQLDGTAAMLASQAVSAEPGADTAYAPIGTVFPAVNLTGFMGAVQVRSVSGSIDYGLFVRYFQDPSNPKGTWTEIYDGGTVTAATAVNTGLQTGANPGTTDMYGQLALGFSGSAVASSPVSAMFNILMAGRLGTVAS